MELNQFAKLLWRWSWLIALSALLAGAVAYLVSQSMVPLYEGRTTLLVRQASLNGSSDLNALRASQSLATTYVQMLDSRPVLDAVIGNLKLGTTSAQLAQEVHVDVILNTELIVLSVDDTNPQRAADIANEIARVFSEQNRSRQASAYETSKESLQQRLDQIQADIDRVQGEINILGTPASPEQLAEQNQLKTLLAQYQSSYSTLFKSLADVQLVEAQTTDNLYVVEPAQAAKVPIRPKTSLYVLLAVTVGAMLGTGLAFLLGYLDTSVNSSEQVEQLISVPTLAAIGNIKGSKLLDKFVTIREPRLAVVEGYRSLRTRIEFASVGIPIRTIVIASSKPLDGKTVTAVNLAVVMAQSGKRVILVDTDLRKPMLHEFFQQGNTRGVTTALLQHEGGTIEDYLEFTGVDNLRLMSSGPAVPNPAELLGSQRMVELIGKLEEQADIVLFDSPPLLAAVDAVLLAHSCDATLLVVRAGSTRADELRRAKDQLVQSGTRLLGIVLTRVPNAYDSYPEFYRYAATKQHKRTAKIWRFSSASVHVFGSGRRNGKSLKIDERADSTIVSSDQQQNNSINQ